MICIWPFHEPAGVGVRHTTPHLKPPGGGGGGGDRGLGPLTLNYSLLVLALQIPATSGPAEEERVGERKREKRKRCVGNKREDLISLSSNLDGQTIKSCQFVNFLDYYHTIKLHIK